MINDSDKLKFLEYFSGREDYFAVQDIGGYKPINVNLDLYYLDKHLRNFITCGIYTLTSNSQCYFICIDIDIPKNELGIIDFLNKDKKYKYLKKNLNYIHKVFLEDLNLSENNILFEDSGGRGYHIWLFFQDPINGTQAVKLFQILKKLIKFNFEFFPKQKKITTEKRLGNLIKLPLGIHRKYNTGSEFFRHINKEPHFFKSIEENFKHLKTIVKIPVQKVDEIIINNSDLIDPTDTKIESEELIDIERIIYKKDLDFLFQNCIALNQIYKKAKKGIALNYKEAFHFANILLSVEDSEQFIIDTFKLSYKTNFSIRRTEKEIKNIRPLHPASCKKLIYNNICPRYCNEKIEKKDNDPILIDCNPLSVNLLVSSKKIQIDFTDLIEAISNEDNLRNTYWKLKKYHENEDALFFDRFDFEYFEENFDLNIAHLSELIKYKYDIPLTGFLKVKIPKKISKNNDLEYRYLSYGSIYDLLLIQSIFNIISSLIEKDFQDYSFGYRVNTDNSNLEDIFLDWREYYPKFRHEVLKSLRNPNNKFYIFCDIEKFYDNICHEILIEKIRPYISEDKIFYIVKHIIENYSSDSNRDIGIPQGPAYSRVLANLYLNEFDKKVIEISNGYFRYVDDFFIFFKSKKDAIESIKNIIKLLNDLGLSLSESHDKKTEILETKNEDPIIKKIDTLKYGIFEEYKFIKYFNPIQIEKFYDAVQRHEMSVTCRHEALKINEQLPSILYLLSQNIELKHQIKHKLLLIINFLTKNNYFYPKRLKYIFYKIIDLIIENNGNIIDFYNNLHLTHKTYFLLTLFDIYRNEKKFKNELMSIVKNNLSFKDDFLKGFSIIIFSIINNGKSFPKEEEFIGSIISGDYFFSKIKLLNVIDYFNINENIKNSIRNKINDKSKYLLKKYLIYKCTYKNVAYVDDVYIKNLLYQEGYMLIPEVSKLFSNILNNTDLFNEINIFFQEQINLKKVLINCLKKFVFNKNENSNLETIKSFKKLYELIKDIEIKRELINELERFEKTATSSNLTRNHMLLERYNQCFYYKNIGENNYDFLEVLPLDKLKEYSYDDFQKFKNILEDLSFNKILPQLEAGVDYGNSEFFIKFKNIDNLKKLEKQKTISKNKKGLFIFEIIRDLYKKANYYYHLFGIIPYININNILVDESKKEVFFSSIGKMFCPYYLINIDKIRNDKRDNIPLMVSLLLQDLYFNNDEKLVKDFYYRSKIGYELFIELFIKKMEANQPYRYSYERIDNIVERLNKLNLYCDYNITRLYFQERLYSLIYKCCHENINWLNIGNSINDFYEEIAIIYDKINFKKINFRYKNYTSQNSLGLHVLSNYLLNICKNLKVIFKSSYTNGKYILLFELLNYYSILCIEFISFFKSGFKISKNTGVIFEDLKEFSIEADKYNYDYSNFDLEKVKDLIEILKRGSNDYRFLSSFSLKQISILFLINNFKVVKNDKLLKIENNSKLNENIFYLLTYIILNILPHIEARIISIIKTIIDNFYTPHEYDFNKNNLISQDEINKVFVAINTVRRKSKIKRYYGYNIDETRFPPEIYCKKRFGVKEKADVIALYNIPLNNFWPSHKSKCSWDISNKKIFNLVIPNLRTENLIKRLIITKKFWYKIIYSSKRFFIFIIISSLIIGIILLVCNIIFIDSINFKKIFNAFECLFFSISASAIAMIIPNIRKFLKKKFKFT